MKQVAPGSIQKAVEDFLGAQDPRSPSRRRERSWDLCFSHFQEHERPTEVLETSCLHLGYYLASWGMLRGSSFLFRGTNLLHHQRVIEVIEEHGEHLCGWDVPAYLDPKQYDRFDAAWEDLGKALLPEGGTRLTLISKVMMGVWGCVPSFDTYFRSTFKDLGETRAERGAFNRAGRDTLRLLHQVWVEHADEIDRVRERYPVWDFVSAGPTERLMTRAKVLDIYGFQTAWSS